MKRSLTLLLAAALLLPLAACRRPAAPVLDASPERVENVWSGAWHTVGDVRLLDRNERQLAEAKASIDRIADVDLEQTNMRLDELHKLVTALAHEESVQRKTVMALLVICIIGLFTIIAKLFIP